MLAVIAAAAGASITALAVSGARQPAGHVTRHHAAAAPSAPAPAVQPAPPQPAPAQPAPAERTACKRVHSWGAHGGLAKVQAVGTALTRIGADAGQYDLAAVEADGTRLATTATAALRDPPPVSVGTYRRAMNDFVTAGNDAAGGDIAGANTALGAGSTEIRATTAAFKAACQ